MKGVLKSISFTNRDEPSYYIANIASARKLAEIDIIKRLNKSLYSVAPKSKLLYNSEF